MQLGMEDEDCECEEGAPPWMATFSDLATLLLTFFVLLLSFAELNITEFKTMLGSIKEAFGVNSVAPGDLEAAATTPIEFMDTPSSLRRPLNDMEAALLRAIRRYMREQDMEEDLEVVTTDRGVVVRLRDSVLFDTGSAELKSEALPILDRIRQLAAAFPQGVSIEGHTDDRPIDTPRFPSNWELSAARAAAALRHLEVGQDEWGPVQIVGYADTRPIASNATAEGRARNRRVEFVFRRGTGEGRAGEVRHVPVSAQEPTTATAP